MQSSDLPASDFLESLRIAAPCEADWNAMQGDDRVRFCASCKLNVFNLSGMSRTEAAELVRGATGRVCVRMLRRGDGTVLTQECPVGLARLRAGARRLATLAATLALALLGACRGTKPKRVEPSAPHAEPVEVMGDFVAPNRSPQHTETKGEVFVR